MRLATRQNLKRPIETYGGEGVLRRWILRKPRIELMHKLQFESPIPSFVVIPFAKQHALDLALLGGPRLFAHPLHVGRPNLPDSNQVITRFREILERAWLSNNGPYLRRFESHIAAMLGVRHCIATCNADS